MRFGFEDIQTLDQYNGAYGQFDGTAWTIMNRIVENES